MAAATALLRRHVRRHLIPPLSPSLFSPSAPIRTPDSLNRSHFFATTLYFSKHVDHNLHALSYRCFSWGSWTGPSDGRGRPAECPEPGPTGGSGIEPVVLDGSAVAVGTVREGVSVFWDYPVSSVISFLDGFHDLTGLPWWMIISTSTLALRASLLPVLILQLKKMGEIAVLLPKLPPPLPPPLSGRSYREQFLLFREKKGELRCPSYLWSFASFVVQFPCFLLWMTSIRRMCLDHHLGFDCGGTLWFQNLTDYPHGILGPIFPILIAGLHFTNVQISFRTFKFENLHGVLGLLAKYYKLYLDVLAIPLVFIGFHIPQGSLVYWATNSSLTLVQQLSLKNPYVRKKLGLPEEKVIIKNKSSTETAMHEESGVVELKVSADSLSPQKLLDLALDELAKGHQDNALPLLRVATEKDPELVRGLIAMGQILCSRGLLVEAAEYFERAISKIQEADVGLLVLASFGAGVSHIWQGNKAEGIEHLKRISQLREPDDPMDKACYYKGLVMLGSTLFQDGEKAEAAKYLRIVVAYDPAVNAYVKECEEGNDLEKQSSDGH